MMVIPERYCEFCGERPGKINSRHHFNSALSSDDCGDWVCRQCEEEAERRSAEQVAKPDPKGRGENLEAN